MLGEGTLVHGMHEMEDGAAGETDGASEETDHDGPRWNGFIEDSSRGGCCR